MTNTEKRWQQIKSEFERGIGFALDDLTPLKWVQFSARQESIFHATKEELHEWQHILICENSAYVQSHSEDECVRWKEYYNDCIILNNYLLGAIEVLKARIFVPQL